MGLRKRRPCRSTGVTLEVVVLEYLAELAEKGDRDRSFCINQIVREHAEQHGRPLSPNTPTVPENEPTRSRTNER